MDILVVLKVVPSRILLVVSGSLIVGYILDDSDNFFFP